MSEVTLASNSPHRTSSFSFDILPRDVWRLVTSEFHYVDFAHLARTCRDASVVTGDKLRELQRLQPRVDRIADDLVKAWRKLEEAQEAYKGRLTFGTLDMQVELRPGWLSVAWRELEHTHARILYDAVYQWRHRMTPYCCRCGTALHDAGEWHLQRAYCVVCSPDALWDGSQGKWKTDKMEDDAADTVVAIFQCVVRQMMRIDILTSPMRSHELNLRRYEESVEHYTWGLYPFCP